MGLFMVVLVCFGMASRNAKEIGMHGELFGCACVLLGGSACGKYSGAYK